MQEATEAAKELQHLQTDKKLIIAAGYMLRYRYKARAVYLKYSFVSWPKSFESDPFNNKLFSTKYCTPTAMITDDIST